MSEWTKDLIGWLILTAIIFALTWQLSNVIGNGEHHVSHVSIQKIGGVNGEVIDLLYTYSDEQRTISI